MIQKILKKIKENKKYKTLSEEIIVDEIKKYLKSNPNVTHIDKQLIKDIRKELYLSYASFQTKKKSKRKKYLNEIQKIQENLDKEITRKLLSTTLSTKERLEYYPELYKMIFKVTDIPGIIVDLGCGINPVSYPYTGLKKVDYYAYGIDKEDVEFLNDYFKIMKSHGLNGRAEILNIRDEDKVSKIPFSDIIFLFKIVDILDRKGHKQSEQLIKQLIGKTRFIVASFATKTLTQKQMNFPKRKWFELMLKRNNLDFKIIEFKNEIFYIINQITS